MFRKPQPCAIAFIAVLTALHFIHPDPAVVGFSTSSPAFTHFTYLFFHANLLHLVCNCYSLYMVINTRMLRTAILLPILYGIAVLASFYAVRDTPTIGASAVVFAMAGINLSQSRNPYLWGLVVVSLVAGYILPGINGSIHSAAFLMGLIVTLCLSQFKKIRHDYRAINR